MEGKKDRKKERKKRGRSEEPKKKLRNSQDRFYDIEL